MTEHVQRLREIVGGEELLQVPSVSVALRDADGRVLLARHSEGGAGRLPGGAIEPGETPADAALREIWEETGRGPPHEVKPDPEIFSYVVGALAVAPEQIAFFDDSLANVEAATKLGLRGLHLEGPAALRAALERLA